jgi:hypothetical protein
MQLDTTPLSLLSFTWSPVVILLDEFVGAQDTTYLSICLFIFITQKKLCNMGADTSSNLIPVAILGLIHPIGRVN